MFSKKSDKFTNKRGRNRQTIAVPEPKLGHEDEITPIDGSHLFLCLLLLKQYHFFSCSFVISQVISCLLSSQGVSCLKTQFQSSSSNFMSSQTISRLLKQFMSCQAAPCLLKLFHVECLRERCIVSMKISLFQGRHGKSLCAKTLHHRIGFVKRISSKCPFNIIVSE